MLEGIYVKGDLTIKLRVKSIVTLIIFLRVV